MAHRVPILFSGVMFFAIRFELLVFGTPSSHAVSTIPSCFVRSFTGLGSVFYLSRLFSLEHALSSENKIKNLDQPCCSKTTGSVI